MLPWVFVETMFSNSSVERMSPAALVFPAGAKLPPQAPNPIREQVDR